MQMSPNKSQFIIFLDKNEEYNQPINQLLRWSLQLRESLLQANCTRVLKPYI